MLARRKALGIEFPSSAEALKGRTKKVYYYFPHFHLLSESALVVV